MGTKIRNANIKLLNFKSNFFQKTRVGHFYSEEYLDSYIKGYKKDFIPEKTDQEFLGLNGRSHVGLDMPLQTAYATLWAEKDIWIGHQLHYDDHKLIVKKPFFDKREADMYNQYFSYDFKVKKNDNLNNGNSDEDSFFDDFSSKLDYEFDYVKTRLEDDTEIVFDIFNVGLTKDLAFLDNNNFINNFFMSDFSIDLNKNLYVSDEEEFNNSLFFTKYSYWKNFKLLNLKPINWKVGFISKKNDSELLYLSNSSFFNYNYSFDIIFKDSLNFLCFFFLPFVFYSFLEIFLILYTAFYFFGWTIPHRFFDFFIVKIIKFVFVSIFGEVLLEKFVCIFLMTEPSFFFLSDRAQFAILTLVLLGVFLWFCSFVFIILTDFFFFFSNIGEKYFSIFEDDFYGAMNQHFDHEQDEVPVPDMDSDLDEDLENELGLSHVVFLTPITYLYLVLIDNIESFFIYLTLDVYITLIYNVGFFFLILKSFYYFFSWNIFFELFCAIDFLKKFKFFLLVFYFIPIFVICFFMYYSSKIYRFIGHTEETFYRTDSAFWSPYVFKMFSKKIKDFFHLFIFSFTPSKYKQKYYYAPFDDFDLFIELQMVSFVHVYTRYIPRLLLFIAIIFFSFFVSNIIIDLFIFVVCKFSFKFDLIDVINAVRAFCRFIYRFDFYDFLFSCSPIKFLIFILKNLFVFFYYFFSFYFKILMNILVILFNYLVFLLIFLFFCIYLLLSLIKLVLILSYILVIVFIIAFYESDLFFFMLLSFLSFLKIIYLLFLFKLYKLIVFKYSIYFLFLFSFFFIFIVFKKHKALQALFLLIFFCFLVKFFFNDQIIGLIYIFKTGLYKKMIFFYNETYEKLKYLWYYVSITETAVIFRNVSDVIHVCILSFVFKLLKLVLTPILSFLNSIKISIIWLLLILLIFFIFLESCIFFLKYNKEYIYRLWISYKDLINVGFLKTNEKRRSFFIYLDPSYNAYSFDYFLNNKEDKKIFKLSILNLGLFGFIKAKLRRIYLKFLFFSVKLLHCLKYIFIFIAFMLKLMSIPFLFLFKILKPHFFIFKIFNSFKFFIYNNKIFNFFKFAFLKFKWFFRDSVRKYNKFSFFINKDQIIELKKEKINIRDLDRIKNKVIDVEFKTAEKLTYSNFILRFLDLFLKKFKNSVYYVFSNKNFIYINYLRIYNKLFRKKKKLVKYKSSIYYRHFLCFQRFKKEVDKFLFEQNKKREELAKLKAKDFNNDSIAQVKIKEDKINDIK